MTLILKVMLMNANAKKHTNAGMDTNINTNLLVCMFVFALVLV